MCIVYTYLTANLTEGEGYFYATLLTQLCELVTPLVLIICTWHMCDRGENLSGYKI